MLDKGVVYDPCNRYTYKMFIYNNLSYFEWGHEVFSLYVEDLPKGI